MKNDKIIKAASIMERVAKILRGVFRALIIVFAVFAVLVILFGERMFAPGSLVLEMGFLKLHMTDAYQRVTLPMQIFTVAGLISACVASFVVFFLAGLLLKILEPMKQGRPFDPGVSAGMRKAAWVVLAGGILSQGIRLAEQALLIWAFPMEEVFSSQAVARIEYAFQTDFSFVLLFFILLFLSWIFSYGQALQTQSDETL